LPTARLALLTAKAAPDKAVQARIGKALTEQDDLEQKLARDQRALSEALKATTDTAIVT